MISLTLTTLLATWQFYIMFAACICAYRQHERGRLNTLNVVLFAPALIPFYITDVFLNWTLFNLMFGKTPEGTVTISDRFKYYREVKAPNKTSLVVANFLCDEILNRVDPSDNHC